MPPELPASEPPPVHLRAVTPKRPLDASVAGLPGQLPRPLTSLVGREADVAAVRALLVAPEMRLLTLTGPGGVGKTRLALAAATAAAPDFPDGVAFVPLAAVEDGKMVLPAVACSLGIREARERSLAEAVAEFLRRRRLLLVLDNVEHVLDATGDVSHLLAGCHGLTVLATSRAPLRVSGEQRFPTPPLASPAAGDESAIDALPDFGAVALFVDRARRMSPDFTLDGENAAAVVEICRRLDGLPLAIELAAAWTHILPPRALLARLEPRLPLLLGGATDQPARLRTMRDAIAWSYDRLDEDEARVFRRLAVFVGGFTLEAAEHVAREAAASWTGPDDPPASASGLLDRIAGLIEKSLLQVLSQDPAPRFTMLETVREFALERLVERGEAEVADAAHAAWFLCLAEAARSVLWSSEPGAAQTLWLDRLASDHDNLRAALSWSLNHDAETAAKLAGALSYFWAMHGHLSEGLEWTERVLTLGEAIPAAARARALYGASVLTNEQCALERSAPFAEEAAILYRVLGDRDGVLRANQMIALAATEAGDFDRAVALYEEILDLARRLGHVRGIATALGELGALATRQRNFERARPLLTEALALYRAHDDRFGLAWCLYELGELERVAGNARASAMYLDESLAIYQALGAISRIDIGVLTLAALAEAMGRPQPAVRLFAAAEAQRSALAARPLYADRIDEARVLKQARALLGEQVFAAAWSAGRALALGDAVAEARSLAAEIAAQAAHHACVPATGLTAREQDILRLLVGGMTDKEIAAALGIGRRTASSHVEAIRAKLDAPSRTAAVAIAMRDRLV